MKKIVFVDVDGTLVNYKNHLPKSAICAIRKARENGHKVFISTGRSKAEVYQEIWDIGIDGMIGGNGSYIEVDGNCIYHQHISLEQCKEIVDWFDEKGFAYYPSDQKQFPYGVGIAAFRRSSWAGLYCSRIHTKKDTVLEETNVNILRAAIVSLITCSAVK